MNDDDVINLPDIADVSFPTLVGAVAPKKKRRRYNYKGVSLSRKPMKFEVRVLSLTAIPRRLDMARDAVIATEDEGLLRATMADIAQYGANEVMGELVRQGAPSHVGNSAPTINITDTFAQLLADRRAALAQLRGDYEYRLCRRRISPARREVLATELTGYRRPGLMKRFANRAVNEAFAFGRARAIAQVRRARMPVEFDLAHRDEGGRFITKPDAVAGGDVIVDAVVQVAVMDTGTCDECADVDGEVMELGSDRQEELHPPYVKCLGGDYCRCVQIALLSDGTEIEVDEIEEDTEEGD